MTRIEPTKHMNRSRNAQNWDIKEKVKLIVGSIERNDNDLGYNYCKDLIPYYFEGDPDRPIIQQKMDNIITLLNNAANNEDELKKIMNMDFENEIWNIIRIYLRGHTYHL